ncbi:hypothetical protein KC315_g9548 [Hortaea werneckii]|nr:hypothetical protein KC315_g9548 [Hortaea werneckii]
MDTRDCLPDDVFKQRLKDSCHEGDVQAVSTLLLHQINPYVTSQPSDQTAISLALSLQDAVDQGHVEIVQLLLRHGANPELAPRFSGLGGVTIIEYVLQTKRSQSKLPTVLDACELLFRKGISEADQGILLRKASSYGRIDIVERLWAAGVRAQKVPVTSSIAVLEFFQAHHVPFDWSQLQSHAVKLCKLDVMQWLVRQSGPCLRGREDLGDSVRTILDRTPDDIQQRDTMVAYLYTSYASPSQEAVEVHAEVNKTMLESVMDSPSHLNKLLHDAVRLGCPKVKQAALEQMMRHNQRFARRQYDQRLASLTEFNLETRIRALQLLHQCVIGLLPSPMHGTDGEEDGLWLTPSMLESMVGENIRKGSIQGSERDPFLW